MKMRAQRDGRDNRHNDTERGRNRRNGHTGKFVRLPCKSRYNTNPIHNARRTGRGDKIPVSRIL